MNFLKKKNELADGIFITKIKDKITKKVSDFYKFKPFPNYKTNDNIISITTKGDQNFLAKEFKKFIGFNKRVLEIGCGTGQLSIYFANSTNNLIVSMDATLESINIANRTDSGDYPVTVSIVTGSTTSHIVKDLVVPKYGAIELLDRQLVVLSGDIIKVSAGTTDTIDVIISGKEHA